MEKLWLSVQETHPFWILPPLGWLRMSYIVMTESQVVLRSSGGGEREREREEEEKNKNYSEYLRKHGITRSFILNCFVSAISINKKSCPFI